MNEPADLEPSAPFQLGDWEVDAPTGRLAKGVEEVRLEPKVMEVLVYLAQHPRSVVSREALEANAWAGMVVGYDAVTQSIIKIRKALGDDSRHPRYIETIPKKGYRLIAQVSQGANEAEPPTASRSSAARSAVAEKSTLLSIGRKALLAGGIGLVVMTGAVLLFVLWPEISNQSVRSSAEVPSIVVLPFKNLSDDREQEYFSDGMTDDLITDLSKVGSVRVIAPQSSYYYKDNPARPEDIARELKALYIVEGSVRRAGSHIRINVQLTNTVTGESIWADRFDVASDDIFQVQDNITRNVINAMVVTLSGSEAERIETRGTRNFQAYDAFLAGQKHIEARSRVGYERAMTDYRRAIELDPNYARAYGAMAVTITRGYRYQWTDLSLVEARERALKLAEKAVELDQSTPQIYWSLGYVHLHRREFDAAEKAAKQSVALSPNYADGYALLAYIANWRGRPTDTVNYVEKAISLNPHYSFQYPSTLGLAYYSLGRYEEAVMVLRDSLDRNESALNPRLFLAATYARMGLMEEAAWEIEQIKANRPDVAISSLKTVLPFEHQENLDTLLRDLRKAGLPS